MSPASPSFSACLQKARLGDAAAREHLFAACRSFVGLCARAHLERRLQRKVDASDLVQQSLLDAHRGFEGFRGSTPEEWMGWLKRVVANNAVDLVRHHVQAEGRAIHRERSFGSGGTTNTVPWEPAQPGTSPSGLLIGQERHLELAQAIERLAEDHRDVIYLRNILQLPFDDVAQRMGRSRGAVQMLWMRALERLRTELATEEDS